MELLAILDELARKDRQNPPSFREFLVRYVYIADGGGTKFNPWLWQEELADFLPSARMVVILKARQLGMSWIVASYAVYRALFEKGCLVLLLSINEDEAKELLAKCRFVFDHLPEALKPKTGIPNTQVLKFPEQHSSILALPSTKRAGRGRTAKLVISDEHAFHDYAEENFASVDPTVDAGGQFLSLSSANGVGTTHEHICTRATQSLPWIEPQKGESGEFSFGNGLKSVDLTRKLWIPLFLGYYLRPGRDEAWWQNKMATYPRPWMVYQEYPSDADEAIIQTGRVVFDPTVIRAHRDECCDPLPVEEWPEGLRFSSYGDEEVADCPIHLLNTGSTPCLRIWKPPVGDNFYLGGVDVSEGLEHGDYSHLSVLDQKTGEEVLTLHGHWAPDVLAYFVDRIARVYRGMYGVERNNHGHACLQKLNELGTPGLYRERPVYGKLGQVLTPGKRGWLTNTITKPLMIDELEQALRLFGIRLNDALNIPELLVYRTEDNGSTSAPKGKFDDRVMALAIAWAMRKFLAAEPDTCGIAARPWSAGETASAPQAVRRYSVF